MYLSGVSVRKIAGITGLSRPREKIKRDAVSRIAVGSREEQKRGERSLEEKGTRTSCHLPEGQVGRRELRAWRFWLAVGVDEEGFRGGPGRRVSWLEKGVAYLRCCEPHRPGLGRSAPG